MPNLPNKPTAGQAASERERRNSQARRRRAIRRAEDDANGLVDHLLGRGFAVLGEEIWECFNQRKREELAALAERERRLIKRREMQAALRRGAARKANKARQRGAA